MITNISQDGARLFSDDTVVPQEFDLLIADNLERRCQVVWRLGGEIGVRFVDGPLPLATAKALAPVFTEVVVAPGYDDDALATLTAKTNLRVLTAQPPGAPVLDVRPVDGGLLVQTPDPVSTDRSAWWVVSATQPTDAQWDDLQFAWTVVRHVRSNAIVLARDGATIGIGAGQMSRVDSVRLAVEKCREARGADAEGLLSGSAVACSRGSHPTHVPQPAIFPPRRPSARIASRTTTARHPATSRKTIVCCNQAGSPQG
jgi:hypothetical protein